MQRMHECGEIQISPASFYKDPSLNPARQDDELAIPLRMPSEGVSILISEPGTDGFQELKDVVGDLVHTKRTKDYYVYCMALTCLTFPRNPNTLGCGISMSMRPVSRARAVPTIRESLALLLVDQESNPNRTPGSSNN